METTVITKAFNTVPYGSVVTANFELTQSQLEQFQYYEKSCNGCTDVEFDGTKVLVKVHTDRTGSRPGEVFRKNVTIYLDESIPDFVPKDNNDKLKIYNEKKPKITYILTGLLEE